MPMPSCILHVGMPGTGPSSIRERLGFGLARQVPELASRADARSTGNLGRDAFRRTCRRNRHGD